MLTLGVWLLAIAVLWLAIMLAPWAINEADKMKGDDSSITNGVSDVDIEEDI